MQTRLVWLAAVLFFIGAVSASHGMLKSIPFNNPGFVLDPLTAPTVGCSFWRRLRTSYTGNKLFTVVRASDSTTLDVGTVAGSDIVDVASLTTFLTATTGKYTACYDQGGGTRDLLQATDANRPAVVLSCTGGLPCAEFTVLAMTLTASGSITPATGIMSYAMAGMRTSAATGPCNFSPVNSTTNNSFGPSGIINQWRVDAGSTALTKTASDNAWRAGTGIANGASSLIAIDGAETTGTTTINTTAGAPRFAGGGGGSTCQFGEIAFWDNYQLTASERIYLYQSQKKVGNF